jgi:thioesterase domain-containing protein
VLAFFKVRWERIYLRLIRNKATRQIASQVAAPDPTPISAALRALASYEPAPYPGDVLLFKATRREAHVDWDPLAAWSEFVQGDLDIRMIAGDHGSILAHPQVVEIARQINEYQKQL